MLQRVMIFVDSDYGIIKLPNAICQSSLADLESGDWDVRTDDRLRSTDDDHQGMSHDAGMTLAGSRHDQVVLFLVGQSDVATTEYCVQHS